MIGPNQNTQCLGHLFITNAGPRDLIGLSPAPVHGSCQSTKKDKHFNNLIISVPLDLVLFFKRKLKAAGTPFFPFRQNRFIIRKSQTSINYYLP